MCVCVGGVTVAVVDEVLWGRRASGGGWSIHCRMNEYVLQQQGVEQCEHDVLSLCLLVLKICQKICRTRK